MPPQTGLRPDKRGQRWVDNNYQLKLDLKARNGGTMPDTPAFTTTAFPGSDKWSEDNPPDILFYLQIPPSPYAKKGESPQPMVDDDGKPILRANGKSNKRKFEILPDRISIDVPGWQLEAWRRMDPRIGFEDIIDRMTTDLGIAEGWSKHEVQLPSKNGLSNHCRRNCRAIINHYHSYGRREEPHRAEVEALNNLSLYNVKSNTVLPRSAIDGRPTKVKFTRQNEGGLIRMEPLVVTQDNFEETTFAKDHFTLGFDNNHRFNITDAMEAGMILLWKLQERSVRHGYKPDEWALRLDKCCFPTSWYDRTRVKSVPNDTFDGGCPVCTWKPSCTDNDAMEFTEDSSASDSIGELDSDYDDDNALATDASIESNHHTLSHYCTDCDDESEAAGEEDDRAVSPNRSREVTEQFSPLPAETRFIPDGLMEYGNDPGFLPGDHIVSQMVFPGPVDYIHTDGTLPTQYAVGNTGDLGGLDYTYNLGLDLIADLNPQNPEMYGNNIGYPDSLPTYDLYNNPTSSYPEIQDNNGGATVEVGHAPVLYNSSGFQVLMWDDAFNASHHITQPGDSSGFQYPTWNGAFNASDHITQTDGNDAFNSSHDITQSDDLSNPPSSDNIEMQQQLHMTPTDVMTVAGYDSLTAFLNGDFPAGSDLDVSLTPNTNNYPIDPAMSNFGAVYLPAYSSPSLDATENAESSFDSQPEGADSSPQGHKRNISEVNENDDAAGGSHVDKDDGDDNNSHTNAKCPRLEIPSSIAGYPPEIQKMLLACI